MKPLLLIVPMLLGQAATQTSEVLVLTTATELPRTQGRTAIEIQNLHAANAIFCALTDSTKAVVNRARRIASGETWSFPANDTVRIWCISATAAQTTGAATVVTELR